MTPHIIRDAMLGKLIHYLSSGKRMRFDEQKPNYVLPDRYKPQLNRLNSEDSPSKAVTLCGDLKEITQPIGEKPSFEQRSGSAGEEKITSTLTSTLRSEKSSLSSKTELGFDEEKQVDSMNTMNLSLKKPKIRNHYLVSGSFNFER